jgi:integrase
MAKPRKPLRRANGEGSVYFNKSKQRWQAQVTLPDGRFKQMTAATQAEALKRLRVYRLARPGADVTLGEYISGWLGELEGLVEHGEITERTLRFKQDMLMGRVVPALGKRTVAELSAKDVGWFLSELAKEGLARGTIKHIKGQLALVLDHAAGADLVDRNVARAALMPTGIKASKQKRESMTVDEARALLEAVKGHRLEALFKTALMLGLRPGELLGLRWSDVDLEAGTITVSGSLQRDGSIGPPKTAESKATLEAPAPVLEALSAHKASQAQERLRASQWEDHDVVFASRRGTPTMDSTLRRLNAQICERAGLGKWTPHEWRHTAASLLLDAGVSRSEVARVLRHKNERMLDETYGHSIRPTVDAAVAPMESIFGS